MRIRLYPYKIGSESGKLLCESLQDSGHNCKQVRADGNYKYVADDVVINLGNSNAPNWDNDLVIWVNKPEDVAVAVCKKKTLVKLKAAGVAIPQFTESLEQAKTWIAAGSKVVCRNILNGHSGRES